MTCEGYKTATITVKHFGGTETKVISSAPGVTISILPLPKITSGQCLHKKYNVTFSLDIYIFGFASYSWQTNSYSKSVYGEISGIRGRFDPVAKQFIVEILCWGSGALGQPEPQQLWYSWTTFDYPQVTDIRNVKFDSITKSFVEADCSDSYPHEVTVKDESGIIFNQIYKHYDTWHLPTYTVGCGDFCPDGTCKCPTKEYPYYCCLDCNSTAQKIQDIANKI